MLCQVMTPYDLIGRSTWQNSSTKTGGVKFSLTKKGRIIWKSDVRYLVSCGSLAHGWWGTICRNSLILVQFYGTRTGRYEASIHFKVSSKDIDFQSPIIPLNFSGLPISFFTSFSLTRAGFTFTCISCPLID